MPTALEIARSIAQKVRFSGELDDGTLRDGSPHATSQMRSIFAQHNLQISHAVTPSLAQSLDEVYERLHIPHDVVTAYVVPDPAIQATCFSSSTTDCVLSFSSGLVELLDESEFQFVAGHEIGHFLLSHGLVHQSGDAESLEYLMRQRAKEISADRIGFIACKSLECSIQAMMKTASGLSTDKLRFDTDAFLSQLQESDSATYSITQSSTHPSILVRCRAVLWFSLNDYSAEDLEHNSKEQIRKMDSRIEKDLQRYVDGPARERIVRTKQNYAFWMTIEESIQDGNFDKQEQEVVSANFGKDQLHKLLDLIDGLSKAEVSEIVRTKLIESREELEVILPDSFEEEITEISRSVSQSLMH